MLVVTIKEDEERGLCRAALREMWRIVKDQIKERNVVVVVVSRNSTIRRRASLKSVMQGDQLKYVDAEGMRVITNSQHVAEQIKIDKGENVVMDEQQIGEFGRVERQHNLKSIAMDGVKSGKFRGDDGKQKLKDIVMDGVKFGKVGKLKNYKNDEEMVNQSEERLCRSIIKGLARHNDPDLAAVFSKWYTGTTEHRMHHDSAYTKIGPNSGVDQGCPLSTCGFSAAIDPVLRFVLADIRRLQNAGAKLFAYLDDLYIGIHSTYCRHLPSW